MQRIAFTNHVTCIEGGGLAFVAMVDGEDVVCVVSLDALQDQFGATDKNGESIMRTFHAKTRRIQSTAKGKISDGAFEPDGSILLRSDDFWI